METRSKTRVVPVQDPMQINLEAPGELPVAVALGSQSKLTVMLGDGVARVSCRS